MATYPLHFLKNNHYDASHIKNEKILDNKKNENSSKTSKKTRNMPNTNLNGDNIYIPFLASVDSSFIPDMLGQFP